MNVWWGITFFLGWFMWLSSGILAFVAVKFGLRRVWLVAVGYAVLGFASVLVSAVIGVAGVIG